MLVELDSYKSLYLSANYYLYLSDFVHIFTSLLQHKNLMRTNQKLKNNKEVDLLTAISICSLPLKIFIFNCKVFILLIYRELHWNLEVI